MPRRTISPQIACTIFMLATSAGFADSEIPPASPNAVSSATGPEVRGLAEIVTSSATAVPAKPATVTTAVSPQAPRESFEERTRKLREQELQRAWQEARRPTEWQMQNPSGEFNRVPTDKQLNGFVARNTYYGPQFREWNQMSRPVYEQTLPYNMQSVPPITQTNVMVAPNTYRGSNNYRWNLMAPGSATANPLGGWNTRIGW